jgi:hypothetical protein
VSRQLSVSPNLAIPYILREEPKREQPRILIELLKWPQFNKLRAFFMENIPYTESELPNLENWRQERPDPMEAKSKTEKEEPSRPIP